MITLRGPAPSFLCTGVSLEESATVTNASESFVEQRRSREEC